MAKKIPCALCGHGKSAHGAKRCKVPECACNGFAETVTAENQGQLSPDVLKVIEGVELEQGRANVEDETILENIRHSIRLGHPQVFQQRPQGEVVAIVGGGPSLDDTLPELLEVLREGAVLVTVNGAYKWCLDHNLQPRAQVVIDARAHNAKFVDPPIPNCRYYLASQCHPETWAKVEGRELVGIMHPLGPTGDSSDDPIKEVLDDYYLKHWTLISGGTTVATRAVGLCRTLGYLRFHLFGIDSCWLDNPQTGELVNHAYDQPENARDRRMKICGDPGGPDQRDFEVSPWHLKQLEDFLRFIKMAGDHFLLNVHGRGLLAYALQTHANIGLEDRNGSASMDGLQPGEEENRERDDRPLSDDVQNLAV